MRSSYYRADGKYKKQSKKVHNGLPYYKNVGESPYKNMFIFWDIKSEAWVVGEAIGVSYGNYFKKGLDLTEGQWFFSRDGNIRPPTGDMTDQMSKKLLELQVNFFYNFFLIFFSKIHCNRYLEIRYLEKDNLKKDTFK